MDPIEIGRGIGLVLPEALKAAGAVGTLLNHAEKKMTLSDISRAIKRADKVGLATMVCADNLEEVLAVVQFGPNIIRAEPESQIEKQSQIKNGKQDKKQQDLTKKYSRKARYSKYYC